HFVPTRRSSDLVEHLSGELWPPKVEASKHRKHHSTENDVVEVRHNEVRICDVEVQWWSSQDNTGQTAKQEGDHEAKAPQHWCFEGDRPPPHSTDPVDKLHARRNCDEHGHQGEEW